MKFKLNPAFEQASGALGELVFREVKGKTMVSRKPSTNGEITEAQSAHRERFKLAAAYGKLALHQSAGSLCVSWAAGGHHQAHHQ